MGNSNTKESRPDYPGGAEERDRRAASGDPATARPRSRNRVSRAELGFLGLGNGTSSRDRDRQDAPFERRETRQEREARRLERERAARVKERERSLQEEHVDGGYLVTMGTYTGTEDFSKPVVRQLQVERRLAPFWRGLNDWSDNWAEHQLVAAARGLPIPAADDPPDPELVPRPSPLPSDSSQNIQNLTVPMGPRTLSAASDRSGSGAGSGLSSPTTTAPAKSSIIKPRARALAAALSVGSRNGSSTDLTPKESSLPHDPFVNGQPLEVFLYKDATECPICFLTYPPYLNRTRCCDQSICSECFVQIKRAEPHLPEHHPNGETRDPTAGLTADDPPEMLISEPSACPYCQQPEFGVTYDPPSFRRGLTYSSSSFNVSSSTAMSSQSSLNSNIPSSPPQAGRRRTHSLSATAPGVITTDRVRPDWASKLASARAHQARRAAAATALHAAAFIVGGNEQRSLLRPSRFSRRNTANNANTAGSSEAQSGNATDVPETGDAGVDGAQQRGDGTRRSRMDELEEMMFMEAVRLSLATEEERKRKEEKQLRKDAKKRDKEQRKAERKQSKDPYGGGTSGASGSSLSLGLGRRRGNSAASNLRMEATVQGASQVSRSEDSSLLEAENPYDKGKGVDRGQHDGANDNNFSTPSLPIPTSSSRGGSHLRQMSNASSIGSSLADSPSNSYSQGFLGPDPNDPRSSEPSVGRSDDGERDTGSEPLFNFRSLAEIVGVNIDDGSARRDGEESESPSGLRDPSSPLPQVREDVRKEEEAEAEHVEGIEHQETSAKANNLGRPMRAAPAVPDTHKNNDRLDSTPPPELLITPETPAADEMAGEHKQLGHSSISQQPAPVIR